MENLFINQTKRKPTSFYSFKITERNQEILKLYKSGKTLQEIGDLLHLTRERIRQILTKQGFKERRFWAKPKKAKLTEEQKRKIKIAHFWSNIQISPDTTKCWEWKKYKNPLGFGGLSWEGKRDFAHRIAWKLAGNTISNDCVFQVCKNHACCNPTHLVESTWSEMLRQQRNTKKAA